MLGIIDDDSWYEWIYLKCRRSILSDSENNDAFTTKHAMKTNVHEIQNWLNKMICLLLIEVFQMYLTLDENGGFKLKCRVFCFVLFFKKK